MHSFLVSMVNIFTKTLFSVLFFFYLFRYRIILLFGVGYSGGGVVNVKFVISLKFFFFAYVVSIFCVCVGVYTSLMYMRIVTVVGGEPTLPGPTGPTACDYCPPGTPCDPVTGVCGGGKGKIVSCHSIAATFCYTYICSFYSLTCTRRCVAVVYPRTMSALSCNVKTKENSRSYVPFRFLNPFAQLDINTLEMEPDCKGSI